MNDQAGHDQAADAKQAAYCQWWLATLGRTLIWAQLRVKQAGTAEVFDSDGKTLVYDSADSARAALLDAQFVAWDGMDEHDAQERGFNLVEIAPPQGTSDDVLRTQMTQLRKSRT